MAEPIISRAEIAQRAREAAAEYLRTGKPPQCPYPALSGAQLIFDASYRRFINSGEPEESEASA